MHFYLSLLQPRIGSYFYSWPSAVRSSYICNVNVDSQSRGVVINVYNRPSIVCLHGSFTSRPLFGTYARQRLARERFEEETQLMCVVTEIIVVFVPTRRGLCSLSLFLERPRISRFKTDAMSLLISGDHLTFRDQITFVVDTYRSLFTNALNMIFGAICSTTTELDNWKCTRSLVSKVT